MPHDGSKTGLAKSLRRRMTAAERRLWGRLRSHRFHGLGWTRQEPIGPYIADFYCSVPRVVIELDGAAHSFTTKEDADRQRWLEEQGILVIRFPNDAVLFAIERVLSEILDACKRLSPGILVDFYGFAPEVPLPRFASGLALVAFQRSISTRTSESRSENPG